MQQCNRPMNTKKYLYVGGGTAGHVYPAQALAQTRPNYNHFLLTDQRGVKFAQFFGMQCAVSPFNRKRVFWSFFPAFFHAFKFFKQHKFDAVFVFGGYVTVVPAIVAWLKRIKIYVIETNAIEGRAVKFIKRFAYANFSSFEMKGFEQVGFLARQEFTPCSDNKHTKQHTILIMGSSIGTDFFCSILPLVFKHLSFKPHIIHHAPISKHQQLQKDYEHFTYEIKEFFPNICDQMQQADLIISRAGASTVAEIIALNKRAILVPYKLAANNHQLANAQALSKYPNFYYLEEDAFASADFGHSLARIIEHQLAVELSESIILPNGANAIWGKLENHA